MPTVEQLQDQLIKAQKVIIDRDNQVARFARDGLNKGKRIEKLEVELLEMQDLKKENAELKAQLAELRSMQNLKQSLYAFVDTFHIKAQRIVDSEDKDFEARELKEIADQMLICVGLQPRAEKAA